jgi:poly(3-hydroxybutyrate) depolymerase
MSHVRTVLCALALVSLTLAVSPKPLPSDIAMSLGDLNPNTFTISGISAGACMAVQFQYAWSSIVKGAGIIASAPYQCSGGSLSGAELCLNAPEMENAESLYQGAELNAALGAIDPLSNLKNQTVFLFSGLYDTVVPQANMNNVYSMLQMAGVSRVTKYFNYSAEHAWITNKYGNSCSTLGSPYINNCNLDFAHEFLRQAFKDMNVAWNDTMAPLLLENFYTFDQTQFGASSSLSLGNTGYMYVPEQCKSASSGVKCHLHLNWHGCTQDANNLGMEYVMYTEINEWAESNNIVVLYPQATANILQDNPEACFDWWGFIASNYATKEGPQIDIFRQMITKFGGF